MTSASSILPELTIAARTRVLDEHEIDEFLRRHWWGILATAANGRPYGVPVAYGMDRDCFVFATQDGMKARNLDANPFASLTIADVTDGASWSSVVVSGGVLRIHKPHECVGALVALQRQTGKPASVSPAQAARLVGARIYRLIPLTVSGRGRGACDGLRCDVPARP